MSKENRATIIIKKNALKQISDGYISSPEVPMVGFKNLRWALRLYRNPDDTVFQPVLWISPNREVRLAVCAYLRFNGRGPPCGHDNNETEERRLTKDPISIDEIGADGRIELEAVFRSEGYLKIARLPSVFGFDLRLLVGSTETPTSRHLLSLLSPVFKSMLQEVPTRENSTVVIKGYTVQGVRTVIDFINGYPNDCGKELEALKFAIEYKLKSIEDHFAQLLANKEIMFDFCETVDVAWKVNHDGLKKRCAEYYRNHLKVTLKPEFVRLLPIIKDELIRMASELKN